MPELSGDSSGWPFPDVSRSRNRYRFKIVFARPVNPSRRQVKGTASRGRGGATRPDEIGVMMRVLTQSAVFVYDIGMKETEVTDEQIQTWVAEAEAGYDVEKLKKRGRGRPGRGAEPMQVVAVRLTADELAALDAIAEGRHLSRSEAIRQALAAYAA